MDNIDKDLLERRLAEQIIYKESLEEKNLRVKELESEIQYLRRTLNSILSSPKPQSIQAHAQTAPSHKNEVPLRWRF